MIAWKRVDFPTLARPTYIMKLILISNFAHGGSRSPTYDTAFQVVARSSQEDLFLLFLLLGRHFLLTTGEESNEGKTYQRDGESRA